VRTLKELGYTSACCLHDEEVAAFVRQLRPGRGTRKQRKEAL
jgi:hypothetical protein